jgi:hypothetical protein
VRIPHSLAIFVAVFTSEITFSPLKKEEKEKE